MVENVSILSPKKGLLNCARINEEVFYLYQNFCLGIDFRQSEVEFCIDCSDFFLKFFDPIGNSQRIDQAGFRRIALGLGYGIDCRCINLGLVATEHRSQEPLDFSLQLLIQCVGR